MLAYGTKSGAISTETAKLGYTGKPYFKDLGLSYYGSRWYDPDAGRFTGIDPVSWSKDYAVHSFNRYASANINPYKYVDPDGEFVFTAIAIAAVAYAAYDGYQSGGTSGALAEASGYNDAVASYNDIKDGNYGGAVLAAGNIVFKPLKGAKAVAKNAGSYRPDRKLPRDKHGNPVPDSDAPHTQLGTKKGRKGDYTQAREFDGNGKPVRDIDFTDHGRPKDHPNPHQHDWLPNPTGGTPQHGPAKPLEMP